MGLYLPVPPERQWLTYVNVWILLCSTNVIVFELMLMLHMNSCTNAFFFFSLAAIFQQDGEMQLKKKKKDK